MNSYKQAKWDEPLIFELASEPSNTPREDISKFLPKHLIRSSLELPNLSEPIVARHFIRLSQMNYSVDLGPYPLGSCTMKYNPKICEEILSTDLIYVHPYQPVDTLQGLLAILYELSRYFAEITGMDYCSLQPAAGAHGEFAGALIIRKYHEVMGRDYKDEIIIPDSAHGTNPASAKMAGFKVIEVPSNEDGTIDIDALKNVVSDKTAGLMLTNPNTLGIFEDKILEISDIIHSVNGLLYYDGANLNAILCKVRPGDMGFDIVHINVHKTFGSPHGGGGPGAGPICVKSFLKDFLPTPIIEYKDGRYYLNYDLKYSIGKVHGYYGNIGVLIKAYLYIRSLGKDGLKQIANISVLNSNYLFRKLLKLRGITAKHNPSKPRKHEFVISLEELKRDTGITALDFAKRLLDYGIHAPTIYFPLIVKEAMMIEPTESLSKDDLDSIVEIFSRIVNEAYNSPEKVKSAPTNTSVHRINEAEASRIRSMAPSYLWMKRKMK